jgi:hypothetical protein
MPDRADPGGAVPAHATIRLTAIIRRVRDATAAMHHIDGMA